MTMVVEDRHRERVIYPDRLGLGPWKVRDVVTVEPPSFEKFPKIPRFNREWIITEKIDGTNAQVFIDDHGYCRAGSRNRWLTPGKEDNFGFASWVAEHEDNLAVELGAGRHFGEWFGPGIGRHYDLPYRRFALFNTTRWEYTALRACDVVPVLGRAETIGALAEEIDICLANLRDYGSVAVPGYQRPEGVVCYHPQSNHLFKIALEGDETWKGNDGLPR